MYDYNPTPCRSKQEALKRNAAQQAKRQRSVELAAFLGAKPWGRFERLWNVA